MACVKFSALTVFLVHVASGIFFNVFDGSTSDLVEPSSVLLQFLTSCQYYLHTAPDSEEICDFLNNDTLLSLRTTSADNIISAWHDNGASNWTMQQVSHWLQTLMDREAVETLLRSSQLTGSLLPSLLLPHGVPNISTVLSTQEIKLLQRGVAEIIFIGPPPVSTIISLGTNVIALLILVQLSALLVINAYAASRVQRCNSMLRLQRLTANFQDVNTWLTNFTPLSPVMVPPSTVHRSDKRRASFVSEANGNAVSVMQQLVCASLHAEHGALLETGKEAKRRLDTIGAMVHARHSWVPFSRSSDYLDNTMEELSRSLTHLSQRFSELRQRQYCMHEAMDILRTLNDCQSRAELSYLEDADYESGGRQNDACGPRSTNSSHRSFSQTVPSATSHAINGHAALLPPAGSNSSATSPSDENNPGGLRNCTAKDTDSEPIGPLHTKIPKLRGLHDFALSPSFYLMNPPSNRLRPPTNVSTPSHIPVGPLKTSSTTIHPAVVVSAPNEAKIMNA